MIGPRHVQVMARYNQWQNASLYRAAAALDPEARQRDMGAFWGSVQGTLCHILWADLAWMSRFAGWEAAAVPARESPRFLDWDALGPARTRTDERLVAWADSLAPADLEGDLTWYSGVKQAEISKPRWLLATHVFNHQTHHRGQAHALLTALGQRPDDTDLCFAPDWVLS